MILAAYKLHHILPPCNSYQDLPGPFDLVPYFVGVRLNTPAAKLSGINMLSVFPELELGQRVLERNGGKTKTSMLRPPWPRAILNCVGLVICTRMLTWIQNANMGIGSDRCSASVKQCSKHEYT